MGGVVDVQHRKASVRHLALVYGATRRSETARGNASPFRKKRCNESTRAQSSHGNTSESQHQLTPNSGRILKSRLKGPSCSVLDASTGSPKEQHEDNSFVYSNDSSRRHSLNKSSPDSNPPFLSSRHSSRKIEVTLLSPCEPESPQARTRRFGSYPRASEVDEIEPSSIKSLMRRDSKYTRSHAKEEKQEILPVASIDNPSFIRNEITSDSDIHTDCAIFVESSAGESGLIDPPKHLVEAHDTEADDSIDERNSDSLSSRSVTGEESTPHCLRKQQRLWRRKSYPLSWE